MTKSFLLILLFSCSIAANGSQPFRLNFIPLYRQQEIELGEKNYLIANTDSVKFEVLRFYISSIRFYKEDSLVFEEPGSYHLIDLSEKYNLPLTIYLPENTPFDHIKFNLGIDSTTNMAGVMGRDLDPMKGMYWTWQSGYINFKLEGVSSLCRSRNHEFQFHLGGYAFPFNALREINIRTPDNFLSEINIDLKKFIDSFSLSAQSQVMSPGYDAMQLSTLISECFISKW